MNYLIGQRVRIKETGQTAVIANVGVSAKGERFFSLRGTGVLTSPWYPDEIEAITPIDGDGK